VVAACLAVLAGVAGFEATNDGAKGLVVLVVFALPALVLIAAGRALERPPRRLSNARPASEPIEASREGLDDVDRDSSLAGLIAYIARLPDATARELADLERVPDWRRDRDPRLLIESFLRPDQRDTIAGQRAERVAAALRVAKAGAGRAEVARAVLLSRAALAVRAPRWRFMTMHRPLHVVTAVGVVTVVLAFALSVLEVLVSPADLALLVLGAAAAAAGALGAYLLPPSARDLQKVIEQVAAAFAAREYLADEHFRELTDGWFAVLEGRWSRGRRPYRAWLWLAAGVAVLVLLGVLVTLADTPA
jgi:hypothetical protein